MIIHLATGQPVQLHIHAEDGSQPPLIIAAPPAPAASSPVNAEPGGANRLAVLRLALVAAAFGLGGYHLAPASRMTSAAPAGLDDPAYRSAAQTQIPLTAAMVNDLARRVRENRGAAEEPG
jgi:hypothetical protein